MPYFLKYLSSISLKVILPIIFMTFFIQWGYAEPYVIDQNYKVEKYISGLNLPTSFLFVENDILVLEKNSGNIRLVKGGVLEPNPVLHFDVDTRKEGGLLGITKNDSSIYVYYTAKLDEKEDILVNQIWKYDWNGKNLTDGKLVKQMPAGLKRHEHNGGAMTTGLDGMVYAVTGDAEKNGLFQNIPEGEIYGSGVVTKVNFDESVIEPSKSENPFDHYHAIGIRNSFGLAVDPITGNLWDTENGFDVFDEVNLLNPKFNSGWKKITGPSDNPEDTPKIHNFVYEDPKFSWESTVAPTALTFVNSDLFRDYNDFLFVGGFNTGTIYQFKLNSERNGFIFENLELKDTILNYEDMVDDIVFSAGHNGITDLDFGPDGSLYVLSLIDGSIYKITPNTSISDSQPNEIFNLFETIFLLLTSFFQGNIDTVVCEKELESRVDLSKCNLEGKNLSHSDLKLSKFRMTNISDSNFKESDLRSADFQEANIIDSDFSQSDLNFVKFQNANLERVNFEKSNIANSHFGNAKITNSNLINTNFKKSSLINANLTNSDLSKTFFRYATLINSDLSKVYGVNADFNQANLTNADLSDSNFTSASFKNIKAKNINMKNSDFSNSIFLRALLVDADLSYSKFHESDFSKSNLSNANFTRADLHNANLDHANLKGANLSFANLLGASINGTDFTDTITEGCIGCPNIFETSNSSP